MFPRLGAAMISVEVPPVAECNGIIISVLCGADRSGTGVTREGRHGGDNQTSMELCSSVISSSVCGAQELSHHTLLT